MSKEQTIELNIPMMLDCILENQIEIMHALRVGQGVTVPVDTRLNDAINKTHTLLAMRKS